LLDGVAIPLWSGIGGPFDDSHFHDELGGMASGLGVAPRGPAARAALARRRLDRVRGDPRTGDRPTARR
jgi:hypothetical protein